MTPPSPRTLLEALIQKLRGCNVSSDAEVHPVAVLWTDPLGEWRPLIPLLRQHLPELITWATTTTNSSRAQRFGCAASSIAPCRWLIPPMMGSSPLPTTAQLPKHLTASKWARCAAIKGDSRVPVPTAAWSWNASEQFATPNGAACFNTGGSSSYAHGGISLQECLTPVLVVSGGGRSAPAAAIIEISWKGLRCNLEVSGGTAGMTADLRRDAAGGPSVATTSKPIDTGGARLLVEDDELVGTAVVAVLLSPEGRVIAQRRTRVGGDQ